ncbi:hypothetical protein CMUS01_04424 [Colletotrichum musicola]|uniref:Helicase C-terminal domain-containing protein n=1 Tax=Colletotrichum musicola TaxID=2175873 RepID=A0A8H6KX98_9PEZI|nr:hypothetical protein CMUS01_04424 [Colletotrichum musicola]
MDRSTTVIKRKIESHINLQFQARLRLRHFEKLQPAHLAGELQQITDDNRADFHSNQEHVSTPDNFPDNIDKEEVCRIVQKWASNNGNGKAVVYATSIEQIKRLGVILRSPVICRNIDAALGKADQLDAQRNGADGGIVVTANTLGPGIDIPDIPLKVHRHTTGSAAVRTGERTLRAWRTGQPFSGNEEAACNIYQQDVEGPGEVRIGTEDTLEKEEGGGFLGQKQLEQQQIAEIQEFEVFPRLPHQTRRRYVSCMGKWDAEQAFEACLRKQDDEKETVQ